MFFVEDLSFWPSLFSPLVLVGVGEPAVGGISAFFTPLSVFAVAVVQGYVLIFSVVLEVGLVIISFQKCLNVYKRSKYLSYIDVHLLLKMQGTILAHFPILIRQLT